MCVCVASSRSVCVRICVCVMLMLRQPQDSLQQLQRKMLRLVVLMLLPVPRLLLIQSACTALNCLPSPLPYLLSSLSLSALAQTSHAVLCSARWGSCCRALSLFICQMSSSSCRSASFSNFCAKRFSFTVAVVLSCVTRRGRQSRGMPSDYLFSHVLPHSDHGFSMAPPSWKQMERKRSSEKDRSL